MKTLPSFITILLLLFFCSQSANAQITVSGSNGVNGNYTSLTNAAGAFLAVNGTSQTGANIVITIFGNVITEAGTNGLNAGSWTSLTIVPSGTRTISGTVNGLPLIKLNGADNVTINGLNTGGNSLTISNLSVTDTGTSTIKLINDASNNTITNCTVLGSSTGTLTAATGNIVISIGTMTGNDNITISNCNLGPAGTNLPSKLITGNGTTTSAAIANSNVTINNNNLYDFFKTSGCAGVYAVAGNTDWSITNNKVYQTDVRTFTGAGTMYGIHFLNTTYGDNIQITGNTIGYASSLGTGTFIISSNVAAVFFGIYLSALPTAASACNINNNTVSDISFTSTTGAFYGIYNATGAGTNSINVNGNFVRNVSLLTTTAISYGIYWGAAANMTVNGNNVYNISRDASGSLYGLIAGTACINETVINNNVHDLSAVSTTIAANIIGINQNSSAGTKVYQNNNIYNLTGSFGNTIYGLYVANGTTVDISGNTIHSITVTGGSTHIIHGIYLYQTAPTMNVYKNKIYGLSGGNATSSVYGITTAGSTAGITRYIYNNFISDLTAPSSDLADAVRGLNINITSPTSTIGVYYNTVYLSGGSSAAIFGTSGIYHFASITSTTAALDLRNNIIVNKCTPSGTGKVVAFRRTSGTAGMLSNYASTSNNNLFYAGTPDASHLIYYDVTSSAQTITAYKSGVFTAGTIAPRDSASVTELPPFVNVSTAPYNLHITQTSPTQCSSGGIRITSPFAIITDYDGQIRWGETGYTGSGTAPDIGADEFDSTYITGYINITSEIPCKYNLYQNYPNPFNPSTSINYDIPMNTFVKLAVYDVTGKELETLVSKNLQAGKYKAMWNGSRYSSGVYFAKIEAGDFRQIIKMIMVK